MTSKQWKIAPVVPDINMEAHGWPVYAEAPYKYPRNATGAAVAIYTSMLSAAPEPDEELVERCCVAALDSDYMLDVGGGVHDFTPIVRAILKEIGRQTDE